MAETSTLIPALHTNVERCHPLSHGEIECSNQSLKNPFILKRSYCHSSDEYNIKSTKVWNETNIIRVDMHSPCLTLYMSFFQGTSL